MDEKKHVYMCLLLTYKCKDLLKRFKFQIKINLKCFPTFLFESLCAHHEGYKNVMDEKINIKFYLRLLWVEVLPKCLFLFYVCLLSGQ